MSASPNQNKINLPSWLSWIYGTSIVWLVPWIIYLAYTLPPKQTMANWCPVWVGLDLAMAVLAAIIIYLIIKKSLWLPFPLIALSVLLFADAWFDTMTANGSSELTTAILMAVLGEIPWALFSIWQAVKIQRQVIAGSEKTRR